MDAAYPALRQLSREMREFIGREMVGLAGSRPVDELKLALQEAAANLIEHGRIDDPKGAIRVGFAWDGSSMVVRMSSRGQPFDPRRAEAALPRAEDLEEGGYGIYLIRRLTDDLDYRTVGEEHTLTMVKVCRAGGGDL
jgi:serine/threonine-protein kinase RsbW